MTGDSRSNERFTAEGLAAAIPDANDEEAAAIAAALGSYLTERERAAATEDETETWDRKRWAFGGRIAGLGGPSVRVPKSAPTDGWTLVGRADRF